MCSWARVGCSGGPASAVIFYCGTPPCENGKVKYPRSHHERGSLSLQIEGLLAYNVIHVQAVMQSWCTWSRESSRLGQTLSARTSQHQISFCQKSAVPADSCKVGVPSLPVSWQVQAPAARERRIVPCGATAGRAGSSGFSHRQVFGLARWAQLLHTRIHLRAHVYGLRHVERDRHEVPALFDRSVHRRASVARVGASVCCPPVCIWASGAHHEANAASGLQG